MIEKKSLICVTCPMGCRLDVSLDGGSVVAVEGEGCKRGLAYAQDEIKDSRRVLTTTVTIFDGIHPLLPVHTTAAVPMARIPELVVALRKVSVTAPVRVGDVVAADVLDSGIDVLASRDIQRR